MYIHGRRNNKEWKEFKKGSRFALGKQQTISLKYKHGEAIKCRAKMIKRVEEF